MMSARSTPNLQQPASPGRPPPPLPNEHSTTAAPQQPQQQQQQHTYCSYLQHTTVTSLQLTSSVTSLATSLTDDESCPPPTPVRDASSLKAVKYGPGHEKFPSWPVPAAADAPQVLRGPPSGGSHRSKSWTDHTNYPKEKVIAYTRPYMKRPNSAYSQQKLKTVMERCEKIPAETYEVRREMDERLYLPRVDREGKPIGDMDYMVPSPPERDIQQIKPQLNQSDLEQYARSYQDQPSLQHLTQADLEEYARSYDEALTHQHQKQPSYAQSEGYHSYVSSTDSMSTPFLDRLRRDSEAVRVWDEPPERERDAGRHEGRDSVVTTSSGSASSSETLKWHGSMSDVSVASSSCTQHPSSRQLIAHSARVQTPQRHNSESVLYISPNAAEQGGWKERENRNNHQNKLRLFPVNTYTVQPVESLHHRLTPQSPTQPSLSVADRVSELERQQQMMRYTYLDPDKKHRVSDPTLKAIQKKALLSFYERHHSAVPTKSQSWRSEPQLAQPTIAKAQSPPPQPPPRPRAHPASRRASSASDYAKGSWRDNLSLKRESQNQETLKDSPRHQHSNSCGSLSSDLLGPVIMGPSISIDDWVPERPPKNPHLRSAFPDLFLDQRVPSPDLPPPSPPMVLENEVFNSDEPLPPPPPELENPDWQRNKNIKESNMTHSRQSSESITSDNIPNQRTRCSPPKTLAIQQQERRSAEPQVRHSESQVRHSISGRNTEVRGSCRYRPSSAVPHSSQQKHLSRSPPEEKPTRRSLYPFVRSTSYETDTEHGQCVGFATHRQIPTERASLRYSSTQKIMMNGRVSIAVSQKIRNSVSGQFRAEPLRAHHISKRPPAQLPEDESNNNSRAQGQVPVHEQDNKRKPLTRSDSQSSQIQPPPLQPKRLNHILKTRHENIQEDSQQDGCDNRQPLQQTSQSKASYLAHRRERERGLPDAERGSYKRTMSPAGGGHGTIDCSGGETPTSPGSDAPTWRHRHSLDTANNNSGNLLHHRLSLGDSKELKETKLSLFNGKDLDKHSYSKPQCNLPDVLPVSAKLSLPVIPDNSSQKQDRLTNGLFNHDRVNSGLSHLNKDTSHFNNGGLHLNNGLSHLSNVASHLNNGFSHQDRLSNGVPSPDKSPPPILHPRFASQSSPPPPKTSSRLSLQPPNSPKDSSPPSSLPSLSSSISSRSTPELTQGDDDDGRSTPPKTPQTSPPHSPEPVVRKSPSSETKSPQKSKVSTPERKSSSPRPQVIEGLQLIQRSEVVLRVNTCTSDAASQTERDADVERTPLPVRRPLQEEIDCDRLSRDLINHLAPSDRLKDILVPAPEHKKPTDYVSGLFKLEVTSRPRCTAFKTSTTATNTSTTSTSISPPASPTSKSPSSAVKEPTPLVESSSPLSATSPYFTTSESKAKFLTRYSHDMSQFNGVQDTKDLNQKKEELMSRLDRKLEVLRSEQLVVNEESRVNDALGEQVNQHVSRQARPQEVNKYRLHVEEVGKITSLLLGLSGRLARAENALMALEPDHVERKILESKRDKLQEQLEDAKKLKESIDRRSINVSNILYKYLSAEEYADYDHFINMKAKLIMDSREIDDKIKLGEEQLVALKETLSVKTI